MSRKRQIFKIDDLKNLLNDENSCVTLVKTNRLLTLSPFFLNDMKSGIKHFLNSILKKYDRGLNGILIGYQNVKVLMDENTGIVQIGTGETEVNVSVEFYIFQPKIGSFLRGVVNKKSNTHIGVLVHKYFNATILKPEEVDSEDWICKDYDVDDKIIFKVVDLDFTGLLPYIEGCVDEDCIGDYKKPKSQSNFEGYDKVKEVVNKSMENFDGRDCRDYGDLKNEKVTDEEDEEFTSINKSLSKLIAENLAESESASDQRKKEKKKKKKKDREKEKTEETDRMVHEENNFSTTREKKEVVSFSESKSSKEEKKKKKKKEKKNLNDDILAQADFIKQIISNVDSNNCDGKEATNFNFDEKKEKKKKKKKKKEKKEKEEDFQFKCNDAGELLPGREEKEESIFSSTQIEPSKVSKRFEVENMPSCSPILHVQTLKAKKKKEKSKSRESSKTLESTNIVTQREIPEPEVGIEENVKKIKVTEEGKPPKEKKSSKKRKASETEEKAVKKLKNSNSSQCFDLSAETKGNELKTGTDSKSNSSPRKESKKINGKVFEPDKEKSQNESLVDKIYQQHLNTLKLEWEASEIKSSGSEQKTKSDKKETKKKKKEKEETEKGKDGSLYEKLLKQAKSSIHLSASSDVASDSRPQPHQQEDKAEKTIESASETSEKKKHKKEKKESKKEASETLSKSKNPKRKRETAGEESVDLPAPKKPKNGSMYAVDSSPEKVSKEDKSLFSDSESSQSGAKGKETQMNGHYSEGETKPEKPKSKIEIMLEELCKEEMERVQDESKASRSGGKEDEKRGKPKKEKLAKEGRRSKKKESGGGNEKKEESLYEKLMKDARSLMNL